MSRRDRCLGTGNQRLFDPARGFINARAECRSSRGLRRPSLAGQSRLEKAGSPQLELQLTPDYLANVRRAGDARR